MNKLDYLKESMALKLYTKKDWMIRSFSIIEDSDVTILNTPPTTNYQHQTYRINGLPYVVATYGSKPELISGIKKNEPLFMFREPITIDKSLYPYLDDKQTINTTIGNLIANLILIGSPFGKKIPFIEGKMSISKIEGIISPLLKDTPEEGEERDNRFIYVDEYKAFGNSILYMLGLTQLCVVSLTEKIIQPPPDVKKLKDKLLAEFTPEELQDPIILDKIQSELLKNYSEFIKGDPGGDYFVDSAKMKDIRKKLYLIYGAEKGLVNVNKRSPVTSSLYEGWKPEDMPALLDAQRAGSYYRGVQTALGGELTKWLFRATTNIKVTEKDCGTKLGKKQLITKDNYKTLLNLYIILKDNVILVDTPDLAKELVGKEVSIRSPLYCHTKDMNFCEVCLGKNITNNKDGISLAIAEMGSMFMLSSMKQLHGKILSTVEVDFNLSLS